MLKPVHTRSLSFPQFFGQQISRSPTGKLNAAVAEKLRFIQIKCGFEATKKGDEGPVCRPVSRPILGMGEVPEPKMTAIRVMRPSSLK